MVLLGEVSEVEAHFSLFGDSVNVSTRRCMVCDESTTGMEIALGTPGVLLCNICQVEACFGPFGDSVILGLRRTYHRFKNHFGCTNGTPT
jgi:hypothetical protein